MVGLRARHAAPLLALPLLLMGAGVAHADTEAIAVCMVLDDHPTTSGVMGIAEGLFDNGYSGYEAGLIFREAVDNVCPEHKPLVTRVIDAIG